MWLYSYSTVGLFNSTVSGNTATADEGGAATLLYVNGFYALQSTITDNHVASGRRPLHGRRHRAGRGESPGRAREEGRGRGREQRRRGGDAGTSARQRVRAQAVFEVGAASTILSANDGEDIGGVPSTLFSVFTLLGTNGASVTVDDFGGTIRSSTPGLGPLQNNGGPTETHTLLPGSAAIDTGFMPVPPFPGSEFDQRGTGFARVVNGTVDIGAFEVQPERRPRRSRSSSRRSSPADLAVGLPPGAPAPLERQIVRLPTQFVRLPISVDAAVLAAEIASLPEELWRAHPEGAAGNTAVPLVAVRGDPFDDAAIGPMAPTPHLGLLPYTARIMAGIGSVVGRSRLMRIEEEGQLDDHVDTNYYWRDHLRVHVPVVTTPDVQFVCGGRTEHMAAGEVWVFDTWRRHGVLNPAHTQRIHLVIDTVGSAGLWSLIERPDREPVAIPPEGPAAACSPRS